MTLTNPPSDGSAKSELGVGLGLLAVIVGSIYWGSTKSPSPAIIIGLIVVFFLGVVLWQSGYQDWLKYKDWQHKFDEWREELEKLRRGE